MADVGRKILLVLLRALVYGKRAVVWAGLGFLAFRDRCSKVYRRTLGVPVYRCLLTFRRLTGVSRGVVAFSGRARAYAGSRIVIQIILLFFAAVVIFPDSRLYKAPSDSLPGQKTLFYRLVGPGEAEILDLEEIESVTTQKTGQESVAARSWREGAVSAYPSGLVRSRDNAAIPNGYFGTIAGGTAVIKPIIIQGAAYGRFAAPSAGARTETTEYMVEPGDVVGTIAVRHGVSVATILWANNLTARSLIRPGDKLKIPPVSGVLHTVKHGDTLQKIASLYRADSVAIIAFNNLKDSGQSLAVGETIVIPGGVKIAVEPVARSVERRYPSFAGVAAPPSSLEAPRGAYLWPTTVRRITQYFTWRHTGIDIAGSAGTPIYAARSGIVSKSRCGWNGGYGCYIVIDHGSGVQSLYGHNARLYVETGEAVEQGQTIALMGSTGHSTGPHVHFEIRINGRRQNPLGYVR